MWRKRDGEVEIKIIDWDTAHLLSEGVMPPEMATSRRFGRKNKYVEVEEDQKYVDALDLAMDEVDDAVWSDLATTDRGKVNTAYCTVMMTYLALKQLEDGGRRADVGQ